MATPQSHKFESRVNSFDESEFAQTPEDGGADDAVGQTLAALDEPQEEQVEADPELSDVDLRLETADYYRAILNHEFFNVSSPAAQVVDREIRSFIRERLEVLLGIRAPRADVQLESPFDDDEIEALKAVAAKVVALKGPQVKKMPTPGAPTPEPRAPAVKAKPQMRKIPAPVQAPSTKPKVKPQAVAKPAEAPKQKPAPAPKAPVGAPSTSKVPIQVEPGVEGGMTQTYINGKGEKITLVEGSVIEEDGRRYKVELNGAGTLYRKDISGQVVPANRLPPMTPQQMSIMSQQMAEQQLGQVDDLTGMAIFHQLANK